MQLAVLNHRDVILQRLAQGERIKDIAKDLGVHRTSISTAFANDPEYQKARIEAVEARLEDAEENLDAAQDGLSVGKAREQLSHARWRAECLAPSIYGRQRQAVAVQTDGPAKIVVVSYGGDTSAIDNSAS